VTYQGKRLYTFTLDKPGKVTGDGFMDAFGDHKFTWHVVHPTAKSSSTPPTSTTPYPY
jgi:predicted lipoprotein with Yx(FWY)xxD motif